MTSFEVSISNEEDFENEYEGIFETDRQKQRVMLKSFKSWHIVICANCGMPLSLADAKFDESFAPIHKKGLCFG